VADFDLVVRTAWEAGRCFERDLLAYVLDDIRCVVAPLPRLTHEQRVQQRIADMEAYAVVSNTTWRGRYPGGPVEWETGALIS
jgi:hypothetical protein